ncbi:hypothetical protein FOA43_000019 [Brettanomyces nanus]|uniref:Uncharacterized protein n=1 Tax=Eeniella nana TaxID=13502 RepID=A0A875RWB1_EENNA|nr:uncharacterized protein FOA43_000019 [Brettanomyces nanus]QPG72718.1 hypothetical protein FOA43_000019 [Brettanomyces nanus]
MIPYEMPPLTSGRRGSIDSVNSSISSGPYSLGSRPSSISGIMSAHSPTNISENSNNSSDVEEDYFISNSSSPQGSRGTFKAPLGSAPVVSPQNSFSREQGSVSPAQSLSSLQDINHGIARLSLPSQSSGSSISSQPFQSQSQQLQQQPEQSQKYLEFYKSLQFNLDTFYEKLQKQYPILPPKNILSHCIQNLEGQDYMPVLQLLESALRVLNSMDFNSSFPEVVKAFEDVVKLYPTKSFINRNQYCEIPFTTALVLFNYIVILSGYNFSLGFGVAFSIFKDWMIFKDDIDNVNFHNLIQLMMLDNCYSLYFGTPRSSTLCSSLDMNFLSTYIKHLERDQQTDSESQYNSGSLEFLKIGMTLIILSNDLEDIDATKKLDVGNFDYKFLNIMKYTNESLIYIHHLPGLIDQCEPGHIDEFIFQSQHEVFKTCKKIINLIDEQLDDFEIFKLQPLLSLIVLKCLKILQSTRTVLQGMIDLNEMLSTDMLNGKIRKVIETTDNNVARCVNLRLPNELAKSCLMNIANSKNVGIRLIKTSTNSAVDHASMLKSWCHLTDDYMVTRLTNDSRNGWCS